MTLARPAWSVTIAAPGLWTYTITQGDDPFGGDLEFVPPLVAGFAFDNEQLPSPVAPDTLQFRLFARNTAALPELIEGQVLTFVLERPLLSGAASYMSSIMRITDLSATVDRLPAVYVDVTAVDILAALRSRSTSVELALQRRRDRIDDLAAVAGVRVDHDLPPEPPVLAPLVLDGKSVGDTMQTALNASPWDVLRPATLDDPNRYRVVHLDPDAKLEHALYDFTLTGEILGVVDRVDLPASDAHGAILQAAWIDLSPQWRRGKESRVNKWTATGVENPAATQPTTAAAEHRSLVRAYGESAASTETHLWETSRLAATARAALPQQADAVASWAVDELTVDVARMTDEQLDELAPKLTIQLDDSGSVSPPSAVAVVGIPATVSLGRIAGRITAARFQLDVGGRLKITPRILPGVPRSPETPSYAEFRASQFSGVTYADVDPDLSYAVAKLARIPVPPGFYPGPHTYPSDHLIPTKG